MWSSQRYLKQGKLLGRDSGVLKEAIRQIARLQSHRPPLPPILSLVHLSRLTKVKHQTLRQHVMRTSDDEPYRRFNIRKRTGGYRRISVPSAHLKQVQAWIAQNILSIPDVHPASHAFRKHDSTVRCATVHCEAKWLVKMDIADFFGSITEIQAFRVFLSLGYNRLVSFEMARLCTDRVPTSKKYTLESWKVRKSDYAIPGYHQAVLGRVPQGAPTSPMLSNLVMRNIDVQIAAIAKRHGLKYTRYSDDMTFSTKGNYSRADGSRLVSEVAGILKSNGLFLNRRKTAIIPPGARKVVLGLLVDRSMPNLSREFKDKLRQHLYYLKKYGIDSHIARREFDSVGGAYRYLSGLINYANMVDSEYAKKVKAEFDGIPWPGTL